MKKIINLSAIFLVLLQGLVIGQNITCETSAPICTGPTYSYPAGTSGIAEPGAYYGCLSTQPAPAWFHMLIEDPGDITIYMYSTPLLDIDFICWGPFTDPHDPCVQGLYANKVVDCSYSPNPTEYCVIPTGQTGEYYILLITNYSQQPAYITFSQTAGTGSLDCSITGGLNADFSATPLAGTVPLSVQFTDESTSFPTIWKWDFENDGLYDSFIQHPSFTYAQTGTYSVKLFVQNETEMDSTLKIGYITVDTSINCGEVITVDHIAGNIAPVTKTTTYGTVSDVPGEPSKCWMTSNLGADHQATDAHDTTEASAGWYWQFNRMQGFMHNGTTRTPNTSWISNINEDSDWIPANDPCNLEIGNGWRIPTQSEWVNVNDAGGWTNWVEPWESPLKLHSGGFLEYTDGSLQMRGEGGAFWSNLQGSYTTAWHERFNDTLCGYAGHIKSRGYSLRCVKDGTMIGLNADFSANPLAGTAPLSVQFNDESTSFPTIWKWDFENDGLYDSFIQHPSFTYAQTGTYSVKLFVQNETEMDSTLKIGYITVDPSINCGEVITVDHIAGNIAPVTKTTTYGTVSDVPGEPSKCWMTSNLGADHQATDAHDTTEASAGWYWQFNRMQGFMHDGTTRTPNTTWLSNIEENSDWIPANDPCNLEIGNGWRIPTQSEWVNVNDAGGWTNWVEPWESPLKLHSGGFLEYTDGSLHMRGEGGAFWSNLQGSYTTAWHERFNDTLCGYAGHIKSRGYSLRCVKDESIVTSPEICIVSVTPDDHNQVIWEKQASGQIDSYNIYRETAQINVYEVIGSVDYAESGIFTDITSNPQQRPYKYKLSAVTFSGTETSLSNYHKTIHLTINEGPTGWNLIWSPYEGFAFGTYYIYRGDEPDALVLLDSISGSFTSYTDINPPVGPLYYAIEIINEAGCFPGRDNGYDRSRSNVHHNGVVGLEDNKETGASIYPNPARDVLNIQLDGNNLDAVLTIYDAQGKRKATKQIQQESTAIRIDDLTPGVYIIRLEYALKVLIRKLVVY